MSSVDIVVPCYNYGRYLKQCVESVLTQDGVDVRVLIIDDASSDDTPRVSRALAMQDARVCIRQHTVNQGNIDTYNEGIEWARGDYFLLLSADDLILPGALARAASVLDENPEAVLVSGGAIVLDRDGSLPKPEDCACTRACTLLPGQAFIAQTCSNATLAPLWTPTAVVRTSAQQSAGTYTKALPHAGDLEMWIRLACRGSVAKLEADQAIYRKHESNMHYSFSKLANLRQHLLAFESAFLKDGQRMVDPEQLQKEYKRTLAIGAVHLACDALRDHDHDLDKECIAFAVDLYPEIRASRWWHEARMKRLFGDKPVNVLKTLIKPTAKALGLV